MVKYEEWYHNHYRCNEGTFPSENAMTAKLMEADAKIADLREKCDKLAGQLLKVDTVRFEPDKLYIITGRPEFKEAVQIAREAAK